MYETDSQTNWGSKSGVRLPDGNRFPCGTVKRTSRTRTPLYTLVLFRLGNYFRRSFKIVPTCASAEVGALFLLGKYRKILNVADMSKNNAPNSVVTSNEPVKIFP